MTTKKTLESKKNELRDKRSKLADLKNKIRELESKKRTAETDSSIGLLQMSNSALRPIGTYNYWSNSDKVSTYKKELSDLSKSQRDLERDISSLEYDIKRLEEQVEYEARPEAELVVGDDSICIKGNEGNNLLTPLMWEINAYINEYNHLIESNQVKNFPELEQKIATKKAELEALVKTLDLPADSEENRKLLRAYQRKGCKFDYIEMSGKLVVDRDFVSSSIGDKQHFKSSYEQMVEDNRKKYDKFEPSFTGKIFKNVGKKQKDEWDAGIAQRETELQAQIATFDKEIADLQSVQAKFVTPSEPARKLLQQISELIDESSQCKRVVSEAELYRRTIESHTILSGKTEQALMRSILSSGASYYLDQNRLKLTKETIFDAICNNPQFADLAQEIINATGYKPTPKTIETEQAGPSNG